MKAFVMTDQETIAEFERLAEMAYAAMYEGHTHGVKDLYYETRLYFCRAIEAAQGAGFTDVAARLARRLQHVEAVCNSQFRNVGR